MMKPNLLFTSLLIFCCTAARSQSTNTSFSFSSETETDKKVWTKKTNVINIYPNPSDGEISISSKTTQRLHFYIFDLEGTLIYQAVLKSKDKKLTTSLKKGTYLYNVFVNDESIEEGKLIIKEKHFQ